MSHDNEIEVRELVSDDPAESPARAGAEQRSAHTPAGLPAEPAGAGSGLDRSMPQWVVAALMVVAVAVGALSPLLGSRFLLVPVIGLPLGLIWLLTRRGVDDESPGSPSRWLAIGLCTVIAAGAFVRFMGWVGGEL